MHPSLSEWGNSHWFDLPNQTEPPYRISLTEAIEQGFLMAGSFDIMTARRSKQSNCHHTWYLAADITKRYLRKIKYSETSKPAMYELALKINKRFAEKERFHNDGNNLRFKKIWSVFGEGDCIFVNGKLIWIHTYETQFGPDQKLDWSIKELSQITNSSRSSIYKLIKIATKANVFDYYISPHRGYIIFTNINNFFQLKAAAKNKSSLKDRISLMKIERKIKKLISQLESL